MTDSRMWLACALCCGAAAGPAAAVTLGATDTFEDGTTEGWSTGDPSPNPPVNVDGGGPGGALDRYLLLSSSGINGPGGKLVAWPGAEFRGNYLEAGVTALAMDLNNLGSTTLSLRLYLDGPLGSTAVLLAPIVLPAGSGWTSVVFPMLPAAYDGPGARVLGNVSQLRLYHGVLADYPGGNIAAQLGVDNVTAVPEPGLAWMLAGGLAALAWMRRRPT
jgi:hypothetical protein